MKIVKIVLLTLIVFSLTLSFAFAAGDAAKGKALFADPKFAGGSKACSDCHPNGKGLEKAGEKKAFNIAGQKQESLEEAINACVVAAAKGKPTDVKSQQMQDMAAYIKSLKTPGTKKPAAGGY